MTMTTERQAALLEAARAMIVCIPATRAQAYQSHTWGVDENSGDHYCEGCDQNMADLEGTLAVAISRVDPAAFLRG